MAKKVVIIGAGRVGRAIASLLEHRGYIIEATLNRASMEAEEPEKIIIKGDIVFLTTPDSQIEVVAKHIAAKRGFRAQQAIFHMSGALTSDILKEAALLGASIASLHPLQAFADTETAISNLPGSVFSIEGDLEAIQVARAIISDLGGEAFVIPKAAKPLYHAAACMASNYLVTLINVSLSLLETSGIPKEKGWQAILPLIKGTLNNIDKLGDINALTGPIARGDENTIKEHIRVLKESESFSYGIYREMGIRTIPIAIQKGNINQEKGNELQHLFREDLL